MVNNKYRYPPGGDQIKPEGYIAKNIEFISWNNMRTRNVC
jgi:hypothetical protein